MAVPNIFATKTGSIPLSELDANFATPITVGTTSIALGDTAASISNVSLVNPTLGTPASGTLTNCTIPQLSSYATTSSLAASTGSTLVGTIQSGTGATARTVGSKLNDIVSVKDFGAVGDWNGTTQTGTDNTAAFQAAIAALGSNGILEITGHYLVSSPLIINMFGITLKGAGVGTSSIIGNHTSGPVIQFRKSYCSIDGLIVDATTVRKSAVYSLLNSGVIVGNFDWTNPTVGYGASGVFSSFNKCLVKNHPGHGILLEAGGAKITQTDSSSNKGHGIFLDDATGIGLIPANLGYPGWAEVDQCKAVDNDGHGICVGNPDSNLQAPYRVILTNNDISYNAATAGVRNSAHQIYIVAEQVFTYNNGVGGYTSGGGGMYVAGRNHKHFINRFVDLTTFAYTIGNLPTYTTHGIVVDDFRLVNSPLAVAVELDSTLTNTSNIYVKANWSANITDLVSPSDIDKCTSLEFKEDSFLRGGLKTWGTTEIAPSSTISGGSGLQITNNGQIKIKSLASVEEPNENNKVDYTSGTVTYQRFRINGSVIGSITSTNGTSTNYNTTSDARLKNVISEIHDGVDRIKRISPKYFRWKSEGDSGQLVDGFIAQELKQELPYAVSGNADDIDDLGDIVYMSIDQSKLTPLLVASVKELSARIEALELKINI